MSDTSSPQGYGSFVQRAIRVTFIQGDPNRQFANGQNTIAFSGLRCSLRQSGATGQTQGGLEMTMWGLSQNHMNELFFVTGPPWNIPPQSMSVMVEAGNLGGQMSKIFSGRIDECQADYNAQPEVSLHISASYVGALNLQAAPSHSFPGAVPVENILGKICDDCGLTLINDGISGITLNSHTLDGTAYEQIKDVCEAAHISYNISDTNVIIWPTAIGRKQPMMLSVSPGTGSVGYPILSNFQMMLRMEFEPRLLFGMIIEVTSGLAQASGSVQPVPGAKGKWQVLTFSHSLDSEMPGGQWFTEVITKPAQS